MQLSRLSTADQIQSHATDFIEQTKRIKLDLDSILLKQCTNNQSNPSETPADVTHRYRDQMYGPVLTCSGVPHPDFEKLRQKKVD